MATTFPAALDVLDNPSASDRLDSVVVPHDLQHANANDAIEAIEAQIGTTAAPVLARLPGVSGGQTLNGGTASGETLTLASTAHATKGKINLGGSSTFDESNDRLGIGTLVPSAKLHSFGTTTQLRLSYDLGNYSSFSCSSGGELTLSQTGGTIIIQGTAATDGPTLGSELLTTAGWTVPGGWTESPDDVFTHSNGGGVNALSHNATIANATRYLLTWTITGRTTGNINIAFGGQSFGSQTASAAFGPTTTSTAGLTITPTIDFDGVLSAVSLKVISGTSKPLESKKTSGGVAIYELRACAQSTNMFLGPSSGQYCIGSGSVSLTALGHQALGFATTAASVTAVGYRAGYITTTARSCVFFGSNAGNSVTSGTEHTIVGAGAGFAVSAGTGNTYVGYAAGYNLTASQNVCLGGYSGRYQADGSTSLVGSNYAIYIGYSTKGLNDSDNYSIVIGANAIGLGANTTVLGTINQTTAATIYGAGTFSLTNATTNAAVTVGTLTKNVTGAGVGAAGLGPRLVFAAESSTTVDTQQADITATWTDATHASRKTRLALSASDSAAAREGMRIEADGSVARLGFFGATAVVKPTALTATVAAAPAGGTGTAAGGWDTAGNRDLAIATINNLKTRVDQLESKLQALGLLT